MGISNLLPALKFCTSQGKIRDFENQAVAVDASSWLHKSVYNIADHYVESIERSQQQSGNNHNQSIDKKSVDASASFMIKRCQELLTGAKIKRIYLVMDGKRCPLKAVTNQERERRRQENLKEARRYKNIGDSDKMFDKYKACIKITSDLTRAVIKNISQHHVFRDGRVQIVWSPYEADAQLVKLCMDGLAQAIITEDSDVVVYSAACQVAFPIILKLKSDGSCDVLSMEWLLSPPKNLQGIAGTKFLYKNTKKASGIEPSLQAFMIRQSRSPGLGSRLFVQACVFAGCDYAPNQVDGVGLATAFKFLRSCIHRASEDRFRHALNLVPSKARKKFDKIEYEELLAKSEAVFYYHPVRQADGTVAFLTDPDPTISAAATPESHRPSLERFGGDWWFLGDVSPRGDAVILSRTRMQDECVDTQGRAVEAFQQRAPPVSEVFVKAKRSKHCSDKNGHGSLLDEFHDSGAKEVAEIVAMVNPYNQNTRKRKRKHDRKPLDTSSSPNKKLLPSNPFEMFACGKENATIRHPLKNKDPRFAKRIISSSKDVQKAAAMQGSKAMDVALARTEHCGQASIDYPVEERKSRFDGALSLESERQRGGTIEQNVQEAPVRHLWEGSGSQSDQKLSFDYRPGRDGDESVLDEPSSSPLERLPMAKLDALDAVEQQKQLPFDYGLVGANDESFIDDRIPQQPSSFYRSRPMEDDSFDDEVSSQTSFRAWRPTGQMRDTAIRNPRFTESVEEIAGLSRSEKSDGMPFGNPSFQVEEKLPATTSKYFFGKRAYGRRVTESPERPENEGEEPPAEQRNNDISFSLKFGRGPRRAFDYGYDDFLSSPPKTSELSNGALEQDDIVESPASLAGTQPFSTFAAKRDSVPSRKAKAGAAKKLHFQVGPFGQAFQRNRARPNAPRSLRSVPYKNVETRPF